MRSIAYPFRFRSRRVLALVVALVSFSMPLNLAVAAEESSAGPALHETSEGTSLFRNHIRELLAHKCAVCHAGADAESGFDLATREGLLAGGELGPAIAPGNAAKSPLVEMVAHRREPHMPQEGDRLTNEEIALVARWIDLGAPYDKPLLDDADLVEWTKRVVPESAKAWWAFQPLHRIEPPKVENEANAANPIDRFVVARLENEDIQPNAPASRRTLIRRAYLDLIGLPPTPDEVDAFLQDDSAEAWSRVLDQLRASGH